MSADGDTILGFTTRTPKGPRLDYRVFDVLHHVAVRQVARAAVNGARAAETLGGVPGFVDRARGLTWEVPIVWNNHRGRGRWFIKRSSCARTGPVA